MDTPALKESEVVVLDKERIHTVLPVQVGEIMISSKPPVKYLGIMIGMKMSFSEQIRNTVGKETGMSGVPY